jgi:hypothetical protein
MTQFSLSPSNEQAIHEALELSKNSWLLAIQVRAHDLDQEPMVLVVGSCYRPGAPSSANPSMSHEDRKPGVGENVIGSAPGQ